MKKLYFVTFTYGFTGWFGRIPETDKRGKVVLYKSIEEIKKAWNYKSFGDGWFNYFPKIEEAILR